MKKALLCGLGVAVCGATIFAATKSNVSQIVVQAQYVCVETVYGPLDTLGPSLNIPKEDRAAVAAVEDGLQKWGRYKITRIPENADIIIVVRKGRLVGVTPKITVNRRPPGVPPQTGPTGVGTGVGVDAGPTTDSFAVYLQNLGGPSSSPQWIKTKDKGLDRPDVSLLQMFREDVENAAKQQQKKKK